MYVCICNAISDRDIRAALDHGTEPTLSGVRELYRKLGREPKCGECLMYARDLIAHCHAHPEAPVRK